MGRRVGLDGSGCRCGCGGNANGECNEDARLRLRAPMTTGLFSTKTSLTGCLSGCKVGMDISTSHANLSHGPVQGPLCINVEQDAQDEWYEGISRSPLDPSPWDHPWSILILIDVIHLDMISITSDTLLSHCVYDHYYLTSCPISWP